MICNLLIVGEQFISAEWETEIYHILNGQWKPFPKSNGKKYQSATTVDAIRVVFKMDICFEADFTSL